MIRLVARPRTTVERLQLLEPFGVAPHLYADVEARAIDLEQLTDDGHGRHDLPGHRDAGPCPQSLRRLQPRV